MAAQFFRFYRLRLTCRAVGGDINWPVGRTGNMIRGALGNALHQLACVPECVDIKLCPKQGTCFYGKLFAPVSEVGPASGFADPPRPLVLRAAHLEGQRITAGKHFSIGLHLFDTTPAAVQGLTLACTQLARHITLDSVDMLDHQGKSLGNVFNQGVFMPRWPDPLQYDLSSTRTNINSVVVSFRTPTEIKGWDDPRRPEFAVLLARLRDRISLLRTFYGQGPLDIDFKALGERAKYVRLLSSQMQQHSLYRKSGRTGQTHSIGGWVGTAQFSGDLNEFIPYLELGQWVGVGRQTVWGKGEIALEIAAG